MMMDGVTVTTNANAGVEFVRRVKSTRAIIRLAKDRLEELSQDDQDILRGPLQNAAELFEYEASHGRDLLAAVDVHKWFLAIDELAEKT